MIDKIKKRFRKKSPLEKFYLKNKEFIWYCIISFICTIILYLLFFIVNQITDGNYFLANFISYTISFSLLYIGNKYLFDAKPKKRVNKIRQVTSFVIVRVIGFPVDSYLLFLLINNFAIGNMTAKILVSLIMFSYNYVTNKLFVFRKI